MRIPTLHTDCNNKAHILAIGDCEYFFSYQTCIAFRGTSAGAYIKVRIANAWGPTTGKHFKALGAYDFPAVTDDAFRDILCAAGTDAARADALGLAVATINRLCKTDAQRGSVKGTLDVIAAALS